MSVIVYTVNSLFAVVVIVVVCLAGLFFPIQRSERVVEIQTIAISCNKWQWNLYVLLLCLFQYTKLIVFY